MKANAKLKNIQVLRAFAAVAVVLLHTGYTFPHLHPFGSFGVDVFFVISGYIMARILDPDSDRSSDFFFRRRIIRIVPMYWFFTILLFLAAIRVPQLMGATRGSPIELLKSLFFIPFTKGNGLIQPLLFLGWSLNYEMFFYLALAIGLLLSRKNAVWLGGTLIFATVIACRLFISDNVFNVFYRRDVMLEFLLGIFAFYLCRAIPDQRAHRLRFASLTVCIVSILFLIAAQGVLTEPFGGRFPTRAIWLGVPALLLVVSSSLLSQAGWDNPPAWLVLIGDASYVLYLIHPYLEYSLDRVFASHIHWLKRETPTGALVGISVSLATAILIHLYIERPSVAFLNRKFGGRRKSAEFASPAAIATH
jgi:exopolysaccharide production protein ExoZ